MDRSGCWKAALSTGLFALAAPAYAQDRELERLSIEQLSLVEVTSVSRRAEPVSGAAASVFVITPEGIRRSGARSVPET
jgi:iron complex outermembrane receptor protein